MSVIKEFLVQYSGFICLGVAGVAFIVSVIVNIRLRRKINTVISQRRGDYITKMNEEHAEYSRNLHERRKELIGYLMDYVREHAASGAESDINLPTMAKILDDCLARGW